MLRELNDLGVIKWQSEWDQTKKGPITKSFFPNILVRLKAKINVAPNFTPVVTGHGNIKSYQYKFKILGSPMYSCKSGEQWTTYCLSVNCSSRKETD
jgi:hypothetical protein